MLKFKGTYEIIAPEDIGLARGDELGIVLGKHSGRHALKSRLLKMMSDGDLEALLSDEVFHPQVVWSLVDLQVVCGTLGLPTASVKLVGPDGVQFIACSVGTGPVDAAFKAIDSIVQIPVTLLEYSVNAVNEGIDAISSTRVVVRCEKTLTSLHAKTGKPIQHTFSGTGAGTDIVVSSVSAYISALNKMLG